MLEAKSICCHAPVLNDVSLSLNPGNLIGIVGPNGAGKTTLLKILAGLIKPQSGQIKLGNRPLDSLKPVERARRAAYLEQYSFVHWPLTVAQLVKLGRYPHRDQPDNSPEVDREVLAKVMAQVGISDLSERTFDSLSGGERARVLLARALTVQADYLLVDEPIASLDLKYQFEIMQLLADQAKNNICVVVIIHDLNLAVKYCDFIHLMNEGEVVSSGRPAEVLTRETIREVFDIDARVVHDDSSAGMEIHPLG